MKTKKESNDITVKTLAIVGTAALILLGTIKLGKEKKGIDEKPKTPPKKPEVTKPKPPSKPKPSPGTRIWNQSLNIEDIKNATQITYYFKTSPKDRHNIYLFGASLFVKGKEKDKMIYLAPFYLIGNLKETKNRKKLQELFLSQKKMIKQANPNINMSAELTFNVDRDKIVSGTVDTFYTLRERNLGISKGGGTAFGGLDYYELDPILKKLYNKWENKL